MKPQSTNENSHPSSRMRSGYGLAQLLAGTVLVAATTLPVAAQNATWLTNPGSNDFNTPTNWTPATVPTGTAFFGFSNTTAPTFSANTTIGGWTFNAGASAFSFTNGQVLNFTGAGIVINGGSASITNNNSLAFFNTSTAGSVAIGNNSVLQFFNASTAGSATITSNNVLQFLETSTAGGAVITNSGGLSFNNASTAGNATITNSGNLTFLDTSTAGSAAIINNATLQFAAASTAGGAAVTNNNIQQFLDTSTAGGAVITNSGGLSFNNASTAGNATITNSGNLTFLDTSTAGSAAIINNATLQFDAASTAGSAAVTNNSIVQFLGTSTAGSAAITNNGGLSFNNASTAGSAAIINNVTLQFAATSTAGSAAITNNGGLSFNNASTAGSAAITNNNVVQFLDASTAGGAAIINSGNLSFNNTSTGGNAAITNKGGGVVDLSSSTGPNNDGKLSAGSIGGAGNYYLGARELTVGGNNLSTTVSGVISDCGSTGVQCTAAGATGGALVKTGSGTLALSGVNTYTGGTTVNAGTLSGTGTIGNTLINSGGTFAPGSGAGTFMTVNGSLAFASGALYLVQINPAAASLANATVATLTGGNVQAAFAAGSYATRQYTILHTTAPGGLGGTQFSGVSSSLPGFGVSLSYSNNQDVILNVTAALGAGTTLSQNQQNVATALNTFFNNGGTLPPNFVSVFGLTGGNFANAASQLSGEAATGAQQAAFQLTGQFLGLMLDPFVDGRDGGRVANGPALGFAPERATLPENIGLAYAKATKAPFYKASPVAFEQRWVAWAGAYGGYNRTSGDPVVVGSHDLTVRAGGVATGLDYHLTRDTVVGLALAGGGTNWALAQGLGGGKSEALQAGVYGATRAGPAYFAASFAFTNHWMSTDRFAAFADHLTASFNAQSIGGRVESGYRFSTPAGGITPYAALQAQSIRTPTYSETDLTNGGFGLTYNGRTATGTRSEVGTRFDHVALVNAGAVLILRGRLAWAHDWITDPALTAVFQTLPGANFIVNGATPARNSALASAGAELRLANGISLIGKFDGDFASRSSTYAGTGTLRVSW